MVIDGENVVIESRVVGDLSKVDLASVAQIIAHAYHKQQVNHV